MQIELIALLIVCAFAVGCCLGWACGRLSQPLEVVRHYARPIDDPLDTYDPWRDAHPEHPDDIERLTRAGSLA